MLATGGTRGREIYSANAAAREAGLNTGDLLSNARSKVTDLVIRDAEPEADRTALERLGLWCVRYTPCVMPWRAANGEDGLYLEVEGSAHLFGGEASLLRDIEEKTARASLTPRLALAATPGTSWAVARFGATPRAIVPTGCEKEVLAPLPLAALRLPRETLTLARRLGLRRIGDVLDKARAPLTRRLGAALILRLDQALGHAPEPLAPLHPPPEFEAHGTFVEPISSTDHILEGARRLLGPLTDALKAKGHGARRVILFLFALDGTVTTVEIGLAAPSSDASHLLRLLRLKLDRPGHEQDHAAEPGSGYEAMRLEARDTEAVRDVQGALESSAAILAHGHLSELVDRLTQRLGAGKVHSLAPKESHIPRRAVEKASPLSPHPWTARHMPRAARPLVMLRTPEPADVMALIPDGPPRQFRWRGVLHHVTRFEGPERISPEWWRLLPGRSETSADCDYFAIEDAEGRRFWLSRLGRYDHGPTPRWFVEGLLA